MRKRVPKIASPSTHGTMSAEASSDLVALHKATLSLFSDLSLEGVLDRVVHAARDLAHARYAALGIPDGAGGLETFLTVGLSEEEVRKIAHHPVGTGLIGEMLRAGTSIRVPEVSEHPKSSGFPDGHPEMHSFLGVPISAYGRPLGQIYLTDKIGNAAFTPQDQQLIEMLAAQAAAAIENSRLYMKVLESENELSERNQQLGLVNSLSTAVGSAIDLETLLRTMLERIMLQFDAGAGEIHLRQEGESSYRRVLHLSDSLEAFWKVDHFRRGEGRIGKLVEAGSILWSAGLDKNTEDITPEVLDAGFGSFVAVPLASPSGVVGVVTLAFKGERNKHEGDDGLLQAVGSGVGLAVENTRLYRQAQRVAVLEERERIGMDLHDGVIQSIYAVGLMLDNIRLSFSDRKTASARLLDQAIHGLNETIRDIRTYILDLQPSRIPTDDIEVAFGRLLQEFRANTLIEADLIIDEDALTAFSKEQAADLFHIAQEALANTAKYAKASKVQVSLRCLDHECVSLQVIDNGQGFEVDVEPPALGHGLSNMRARAYQVGGEFEIVSNPGEGTTVTVRIPSC